MTDGKPRRIAKGTACVCAFLLSLALVCAALHSVLPPLRAEVVSRKLDYIRAHRGEIDVIFIGASTINRGIDPEKFDGVLQARGTPLRSFNLGIDGMTFPEMFFVLDQVLGMRLPHLKWLVLESGKMVLCFDVNHPIWRNNSSRLVYWHTPGYTALLFREFLRQAAQSWQVGNLFRRLPDLVAGMGTHASLFVKNYANLGRVVEARPSPAPDDVLQVAQMGRQFFRSTERGFVGIDTKMPDKFLEDYKTDLEKRMASPQAAVRPGEALTEFVIAGEVAQFQKQGTSVALLIPPDDGVVCARYGGLSESQPVKTFLYSDPVAYPSLYEIGHRYDGRHLNKAGAEVFTEMFAKDFADHLHAAGNARAPR